MTKAMFSYGVPADFYWDVNLGVIVIQDLDIGGKSVTNDMESVLKTIEAMEGKIPSTQKIIYRDSEGIYDGVKWDGETASFIPLQTPSICEALEKIKEIA